MDNFDQLVNGIGINRIGINGIGIKGDEDIVDACKPGLEQLYQLYKTRGKNVLSGMGKGD